MEDPLYPVIVRATALFALQGYPGERTNSAMRRALADDEALTTQLFRYRYRSGGLEGHSFGNLFITAMATVTGLLYGALA